MIGTRPLTDKEIETMVSYFNGIIDSQGMDTVRVVQAKRDKLILLLGVKTGFRISELLSIKIKDLKEPGGYKETLTINRSNMKGKHSSRCVPLHKYTIRAIADYIATLPRSQKWLFQSQKGGQLSRIQAWRAVKETAVACGINGKIACHSLRKSFAKKVYKNLNNDLVKTQKAMGHASISSTARYLSFTDIEIDKAILGV